MMNQIKISIVIMILLVGVTVAQQPFEYKIFMQKDTFLVGELIDVGVNIINTSNVIQTSGYVNIKVFNEKGEALRGNNSTGDLYSPEHIELKPNDETYRVQKLNFFFGDQHSAMSQGFLKEGTYIIKVSFFSPVDKHSFRVERVIKVIKPEGEEAMVYNSYVSICKRKPYDPKQTVVDLEALVEAHPNSIYAPMLLCDIRNTYGIILNDQKNYSKINRKLAEKYAWSSEAQYELNQSSLEKTYSNRQERITYLKGLIPVTKNSPMQKLIELKLKTELEK